MSWVFLTHGFAYKLKKPVCYADLDFRTLAARQVFCQEEDRLNRRLAAKVYLGLLPLSVNAQGQLHLGEGGTPVDWLVKMHRLPQQNMLDSVIRHGGVSGQDVARIVRRLVAFYRNASPVTLDPLAHREGLHSSITLCNARLCQAEYALPQAQIARITDRLHRLLAELGVHIERRILSAKYVEAHGDLRPEHICLTPHIVIIDCLEFSRTLRILDPIDELGFLALECERLGAPDSGALFLRTYSELSGDWANSSLLHFYQSYRACLRAQIAIRHLDEEKYRTSICSSAKWRQRACDYLHLAERHQLAINATIDPPV